MKIRDCLPKGETYERSDTETFQCVVELRHFNFFTLGRGQKYLLEKNDALKKKGHKKIVEM